MNSKPFESNNKEIDQLNLIHFFKEVPLVVKDFSISYNSSRFFSNVDSTPISSIESVIQIIHQIRRIIFPGYFSKTRLDSVNLEYYLGQETIELLKSLANQILLSLQHECLRFDRPCSQCTEKGLQISSQFVRRLPKLRELLTLDVQAAMEGDPAAKNHDEIIHSYPGIIAISIYRVAHELHLLNVPLLPRRMTEYAHSRTGIDIHPGAKIGKSFFIDHGTGVVVGETTVIGDRVRLYQGVTLGAISLSKDSVDDFRGKKRHPTIGDDVIIYSNATLLGENAEIGARSIIGGNVWITEPVPPDTKVLLKKPELIYIGNGN